MTANERRAEIMRIMTARRQESMGRLALELGVTRRTSARILRRSQSIILWKNSVETADVSRWRTGTIPTETFSAASSSAFFLS